MKRLVLIIISVFFACSVTIGRDFYVASDGSDANPGTKEKPFASLKKARDKIRKLKQVRGLPQEGVTVWIKGGLYKFDKTLKLTARDSGTKESPIVYRACKNEKVIFDGGKRINAGALRLVSDETTLDRLCPAARGYVLSMPVKDTDLIKLLKNDRTILSFNNRMMQLARFPSAGFCHIDTILDNGAVYIRGRTFGDRPKYDMENPVGGEFIISETPSGNWEKEFARIKKAKAVGYLAYDWYRESHRIASIKGKTIKLLEYSSYGIENHGKSIPRRLVVINLLCELDNPGEWYFDEIDSVLFIRPFEPVNESTNIVVWAGPAFAELSDASYITIRNLTIQSTASGGGMVSVSGGLHNRIAGCTLRNTTQTAVRIDGGTDNGVISCDIYDVSRHIKVSGGDTPTLTPAGNYAINCDFTQLQAKTLTGGVGIAGVGNIFRNNLVHNLISHPIGLSGNDHTMELNEVFNCGIEVGDGGNMGSGACMWSYGNVYRHNFLHNLYCVPQAHARGGIYPDDLDAGDLITENIFYKCAHRAVLLNGGAGHTVSKNVFINGYIGIYNTTAWSEGIYNDKAKYDSGKLKRGDKCDHIWRTEQVVGKKGWNNPPWSTKYPLFKKIMNQEKMRFWPIECKFKDNLFCGNKYNFQFRTGWGKDDLVDIHTIDYIETTGSREIKMDVFVDPENMDFRFKKIPETKGFPDIPFEKIGLYVDEFRKTVPDKKAYRSAINERFKNRPSYDENAKYDPATINEFIYFNTGKLLLGQ